MVQNGSKKLKVGVCFGCMRRYDFAIVGAGVCGAWIAYELSKRDVSVVVLEKESDVCMGTSKANSAIVHAGYDPMPDSNGRPKGKENNFEHVVEGFRNVDTCNGVKSTHGVALHQKSHAGRPQGFVQKEGKTFCRYIETQLFWNL